MAKDPPTNAGDVRDEGSMYEMRGRSHGEGHGNPLQYSRLENLHGQRNLMGYSPRGHTELDLPEAS